MPANRSISFSTFRTNKRRGSLRRKMTSQLIRNQIVFKYPGSARLDGKSGGCGTKWRCKIFRGEGGGVAGSKQNAVRLQHRQRRPREFAEMFVGLKCSARFGF